MAPVLEISDGRGKLLPFANLLVLATILHPDDAETRDWLFESLVARTVIERRGSLPRTLRRLATERSVQADSLIERATKANAYGVAVAGDLLMFIATAAAYSPKNASLARAVRAWCEDQTKGRTHDGGKVAASPRAVRAAWARFKSIAHLCAAFRLQSDLGEQFELYDRRKLPNFLAAAEAFRIFGEHHHPPIGRFVSRRSKATTLDPEGTWHLPSDLPLPAVFLEVPRPTPFAQKIFSEYRAD